MNYVYGDMVKVTECLCGYFYKRQRRFGTSGDSVWQAAVQRNLDECLTQVYVAKLWKVTNVALAVNGFESLNAEEEAQMRQIRLLAIVAILPACDFRLKKYGRQMDKVFKLYR